MLENPVVLRTGAQPTAKVHLTVPAGEIRSLMGPALAEVRSAVAAQGIPVTGPWFTHHLTAPGHTWNFEICVPVASPIVSSGRVEPGHWPAMEVARAVYSGPYEKLSQAWGQFDAWIQQQLAGNGHTPASDLWERYLVGPDSNPDPATWRTELNRPLIPATR